jgi:hypothetical protein
MCPRCEEAKYIGEFPQTGQDWWTDPETGKVHKRPGSYCRSCTYRDFGGGEVAERKRLETLQELEARTPPPAPKRVEEWERRGYASFHDFFMAETEPSD